MANGNQRRDIRELLRDKDFLNQNLQSFCMDQNTLPFGSAGALRRVVGGGLLGGPKQSVGFPRNTGGGSSATATGLSLFFSKLYAP